MIEPTTARPTRFRTAGISPRKPTRFDYRPDDEERSALVAELGLLALHGLNFSGEITPSGRDELVLTGQISAKVDQACVVTLAPVRTEISEPVRRRFVVDLSDPAGEEMEVPEDDSVEPMPEVIDLVEIASEALALALPLYPRAPGAGLGETVHAADGVDPLKEVDLKPFSGLAGLAKRLSGSDTPGSDEGR